MVAKLSVCFQRLYKLACCRKKLFLIKTLREVQKIGYSTPNGRPASSSSSVYTTFFTDDQLHKNPAFQPLADHILVEARVFGKTLGIDFDNFELAFKD